MVRTQHPANLLLAALTLALIAWCGTRSEAAAQGPQSPQENKQDKIDPSIGEMPLPPPPERPKVLANLYEQLGAAKDATAAQPITESIETLWGQSGSDT